MLNYLAVGVGGALGSVGRFWLNGLISRRFGETFPFGTLFINVSGSFLIAFFATMTAPEGRILVSPTFRTFFMIDICGGYTTFSSFSLQTLNLALDGEWLYAGANTVLSVVLCLAAAWLGYVAALAIKPMKGH
ncbi:MAG: fluoride efflux transporter CrcB [Verrucomicrobiota bacterium]|jgi:CrcB protein